MKALSQIESQTCLTKLAYYVSERMSVDLYYLVEVIYHLISIVGEKKLETEYPDYLKVKKKLEKLSKVMGKSKKFYDIISDKNFKTKFKEMDEFQKFLNNEFIQVSSKIPALQLDVYKLFHYLVKETSLQSQTIRQDMLKILEYRDNLRIDPSKRRREQTPLPPVHE